MMSPAAHEFRTARVLSRADSAARRGPARDIRHASVFWNLSCDLESAARIDGASEWRTYTNIMLPLALPGLNVLVIFTFEDAWNDFLWPLIVLYSERLYTVQIGLLQFQTDTGAFWNWLMAATVSVTVPMIVVFLVFQRYFFKGITFEGFTK